VVMSKRGFAGVYTGPECHEKREWRRRGEEV
jgi:hypothetical protein